ncbi:hypothetical protein JNUCC0626_13650 [Lentzea sp. JNUCC 0626]|uniref:hypothetical protein n=1 Tax=Lentzea sp. JNUCC 0626 TaxID=3367513 RepID=UPI00374A3217
MKIMCRLLGLMTLVLVTAVVVVWRFLLVDVDDRVNRALEQETGEFIAYAENHTGDAGAVAEGHLRLQSPDEHELHLAVLPGRVLVQRSGVTYALENDRAALDGITSSAASWGVVATPAGPFRWAKVRTTAPAQMWFVTGYFEDGVHAQVHSTVRVLVLVSLAGLLIAWFAAGGSWRRSGGVGKSLGANDFRCTSSADAMEHWNCCAKPTTAHDQHRPAGQRLTPHNTGESCEETPCRSGTRAGRDGSTRTGGGGC